MPPKACDWLLNECIGHLQKNCLLPKSLAISWLFGSCLSDCSSHLCGSEILCRSWQCSKQQHHLFVLYSMPRQKSWYCLQVPISSLTKHTSPVFTCSSVTLQLFYQVGWGLWGFGMGSFVGREGWSSRTTKKPGRYVFIYPLLNLHETSDRLIWLLMPVLLSQTETKLWVTTFLNQEILNSILPVSKYNIF